MVSALYAEDNFKKSVSVLALSSRFDGHSNAYPHDIHLTSFSTRSVESF